MARSSRAVARDEATAVVDHLARELAPLGGDARLVVGADDVARALAAVGLASFANFFGQAFLTGLATGVQAMAARRLGEGRESETAVPLNGSLALSLLIGIPLTVVIWNAAPYLFPYLVDDPLVVENGVPYWRARAFAITAVGMNFSFRGFWNGVNLSTYLTLLSVTLHRTLQNFGVGVSDELAFAPKAALRVRRQVWQSVVLGY